MSRNGYAAVLLVVVALAASAGLLSANVLSIGPSIPADHEEALAAAGPASVEELGKLLFFDTRLSGDTSISCSTCHAPGNAWADGLALSAGYQSTLHFRNTPTILNAGRMPLLDWDGRFAAGDMDSLVRDHLAEAHFMNVDGRLLVERLRQVPVYEQAFQATLRQRRLLWESPQRAVRLRRLPELRRPPLSGLSGRVCVRTLA